MKIKHALFIFLVAMVIRFFGMTFKWYHWPGADIMIIVSQAAFVIAIICIIYALATNEKVRKLLKGE